MVEQLIDGVLQEDVVLLLVTLELQHSKAMTVQLLRIEEGRGTYGKVVVDIVLEVLADGQDATKAGGSQEFVISVWRD